MNKYEIVKIIENFAPLETQEKWDCSGWLIDTENKDVNKIMLALTVTDDIVKQAIEQNCDMIISHHPLFFINCNSEFVSKNFNPKIDIYCAHTNMDLAKGGTTDNLINKVIKNFDGINSSNFINMDNITNVFNPTFVRYLEFKNPIKLKDFSNVIKQISQNARLVNNQHVERIRKIGFCVGSGSEFINEAYENNADCFVTGDLKFHTALESPIVVYDIGHFASEIGVLQVFKNLLKDYVEITFAKEKSPFEQI